MREIYCAAWPWLGEWLVGWLVSATSCIDTQNTIPPRISITGCGFINT